MRQRRSRRHRAAGIGLADQPVGAVMGIRPVAEIRVGSRKPVAVKVVGIGPHRSLRIAHPEQPAAHYLIGAGQLLVAFLVGHERLAHRNVRRAADRVAPQRVLVGLGARIRALDVEVIGEPPSVPSQLSVVLEPVVNAIASADVGACNGFGPLMPMPVASSQAGESLTTVTDHNRYRWRSVVNDSLQRIDSHLDLVGQQSPLVLHLKAQHSPQAIPI